MNCMNKLVAFFIFLISGIFITYPWIFHLTDYVTGYGDNFIYVWIHTWVIQSLISGNIQNIFTTNIFYPYQIGPASSDPNLITALFSLIPYLITKEPIITVNFTTIFSIVLTGFSIYLLAFKITKNFLASILSGILVVFSPAYLSFYAHIQMLFIVLVPLSLMYFLTFMESKKTKYLTFSLIFFLLQTYNNFMAGYFILFSYLIIFIFNLIADKKKSLQTITKKNAAFFIIFLALIIPVMIPYFSVSKEFGYTRTLKDTAHFAIQPEDMLYSSDFSRFHLFLNTLPINRESQNNEFKPGYLGAVFSILVIFAFVFAFKNLKKKNVNLNSFLSISILSFTLSLGPVLHLGRQTIHNPSLIPLPYALFYFLIPGFKGFRNTARWEILLIIGAAIVIAIVLDKVLKKYSFNKKIIIYGALILGCVIELNFPMSFVKIPKTNEFPKEHIWLSSTPKETKYIEMPIYNWDMYDYASIELWRLYYSTTNYRRTVNGGGGFTPPEWQKMIYSLNESFPSDKSIDQLKNMNIDYIIIHKNEYDRLHKDKFTVYSKYFENGNQVLNKINQNKNLELVEKFGDSYIYKIN